MNPYVYFLIALQLLTVSLIDLKTKLISNYWHLVNIVISVGLYIFLSQEYELKWELFLLPAGFVLIGFLLFLMGIMGAGDSKYLASLSLLIPAEYHIPFFERLLWATMAVGALLVSFRVLRDFKKISAYIWSRYWQALRDLIKSEFSYAPVIFLAWLLLGVEIWK
jgi:prepilin peptidase CpaA